MMRKVSARLVILCLLTGLAWPWAGIASGAGGPPPLSGQPRTGARAPQSPQAPAAASWYDGQIQYSTITNCPSIIFGSPYQENGVGTYVGFLADPNAGQPAPNTTYYAHILIYGLGNACSGMRAYPDLALPASTSLAITNVNPVYCFYDGVAISPPSDCPQTLPASSLDPGAFDIPSTDAAHAHTWPIPQGHNLEIQVPLKSSASLTNSPLQGNVWMADGNSNPTLRPTEGVYVFSSGGGSSATTILYPSPSTLTVTTTTGHSQAYLYTNLGGIAYFDLGTSTSYTVHDSIAIAAGGPAWLVWDDWGPPPLSPDTLYHWRLRFVDSNNQTYLGTDQTFRTLPDGLVTIGTGTFGSCSGTDFNTAVTTAKTIKFNCGSLPVVLSVAPHLITTNLTIDGGNKVILDAGGTDPHFGVEAGAALTLTNITLTDGYNNYPLGTYSCGGAVVVTNTAHLTLATVYLINNHSQHQGGAVCVEPGGFATITGSLFAANRAGNHGGAIGNYGTVTISGTRFVSNTAPLNGGAIDTTGVATVQSSVFFSNTAGARGGGINNYQGQLQVWASLFLTNTAGSYGGGLSNDSDSGVVSNTVFTGNFAQQNGGGLESAGTLNLTNSTVSGNGAHLNGGGVYFSATEAVTLMLLNDTVVSNTAGTQGGNISFAGVPTSTIALKNTLVAFGSPNNCDQTLSTQGNNLENTNVCGFSGAGDLINSNPKIGGLRDNGGSSLTHGLLTGSPAIDAGNNSGCPATDQRGLPRPKDGDGNGSSICDIGAFERQPGETVFAIFLPFIMRQTH